MVLMVVGKSAEAIEVEGLTHWPQDVEGTVAKCHRSIPADGCVIFQTETNETVCAVETNNESELLNAVPRIVQVVLERHRFLLDVIVFVGAGMLAKSRMQEKQRGKIALAYALDRLLTSSKFEDPKIFQRIDHRNRAGTDKKNGVFYK
ncbi:hypothetical protein HK104_004593 [Borealophlyctis nickersoniae]|nr:hypothetical protein HK104_004593 [Borealophlyctis nickersoniae]